MITQSSNISPETEKELRQFCYICQYIYGRWITSYALFEELPNYIKNETDFLSMEEFLNTPYGSCLVRLREALNQDWILGIAKLHDPAGKGQNSNLCIDYIVKQRFWARKERVKIKDLVSQMYPFFEKIKPARDKVLSHNDLLFYKENKIFEIFSNDCDDEEYFKNLAKLCDKIWNKMLNKDAFNRKQFFEFSRSGIVNDPLCPANEARALRDLIVEGLKKKKFKAIFLKMYLYPL